MANDKPKEVAQPSDSGARDTGGDKGTSTATKDDRQIMTATERAEQDRRDRDTAGQQKEAFNKEREGATDRSNREVGTGKDIYASAAVQQSIKDGQTTDPTVQRVGESLSFAGFAPGSVEQDIVGRQQGKGGQRVGDKAVTAQDQPAAPGQSTDNTGKPGDNLVGKIDPARDNPAAVEKRYDQNVDSMVGKVKFSDGSSFTKEQADQMKAQFASDMAKMQDRFKDNPQTIDHAMHAMNLMMDDPKGMLQNKVNEVNAVSGLAARGADPEEANRQGEHPTCALTSESRIEQERNFSKYADQMGSIAANGGAWRGGENGTKPVWVDIAKAGNGANLKADLEASVMYNQDTIRQNGIRDYLGQLDNAVVGGEMAMRAKELGYNMSDQRTGYVTANQGKEGGAPPDSDPDVVGYLNYANGGGGLFVQEGKAQEYAARHDGQTPPWMNTFSDANDLKTKMASLEQQNVAQGKGVLEYQILTNGSAELGRPSEHGLHAQEVKYQNGQLVFGNNWTENFNHVAYDNKAIDTITFKDNSGQPLHTADGKLAPQQGGGGGHFDRVGPTYPSVSPDATRNHTLSGDGQTDDKNKDEQKNRDKEDKTDKNKQTQQEMNEKLAEYQQKMNDYNARLNNWVSQQMTLHPDQPVDMTKFGEQPPHMAI